MFRSINFKLLAVITSAFVFASFCILLVADIRLSQIIDKSQDAVFREKIDTMWHALDRKNTRLKKTGLMETYIEDFQESAVSVFRSEYYKKKSQSIFPFIINLKGKVVMHPLLPKGADAMALMALPGEILTQNAGTFEHHLPGENRWTAFRQFQGWGWVVGYTIPLDIKYADAKAFRKTLVMIIGGISFLVLMALFIFVTRFTRPIVKLTAISTQMAAGYLDQKIDTGGNDEIAVLSRSFSRMQAAVKQQIAALRSEKKRVENIIEGTNAGTWDWRISTGEMVVNPRWAEIVGMNVDDLTHIDINQWRQSIHSEDRDRIEREIQRHFDGETEYFNAEYRQKHPADEWHWVSTHGKVVERDDNGSPTRMSGTHLDITENKKTEIEKDELEGQLRQAQKMEAVGRLAGGVAHDFNNMLSVILGQAEMVLTDLNPQDPLSDRVREIKKAGERSVDLTRQLLAFARKQTVSPVILNLNQTVSGMTKMLQRLIGEDVELTWLPCDTALKIKMDPGQIDQILANLCVNARDAIADVGKITIETGCKVFDEAYCAAHLGFLPGRYALISVSDNGSGMDSETLDFIFEPFFTTKKAGKGTGLGLATVYGIVKQNNGFINVYSELDHGTTIRIYLPEYLGTSQKCLAEKDEKSVETGDETILLVEDEPAILRMTEMMLTRLGYRVITASSPAEAVHTAKSHTGGIQLLLTDVIMPEMNGWDLAETILSLYPDIDCLFMSGYTSDVIARHGVLNDGVNFISKPFSANTLAMKIRKVIDGEKKTTEPL